MEISRSGITQAAGAFPPNSPSPRSGTFRPALVAPSTAKFARNRRPRQNDALDIRFRTASQSSATTPTPKPMRPPTATAREIRRCHHPRAPASSWRDGRRRHRSRQQTSTYSRSARPSPRALLAPALPPTYNHLSDNPQQLVAAVGARRRDAGRCRSRRCCRRRPSCGAATRAATASRACGGRTLAVAALIAALTATSASLRLRSSRRAAAAAAAAAAATAAETAAVAAVAATAARALVAASQPSVGRFGSLSSCTAVPRMCRAC